jgi:hypothetical protein
MAVVSRAPGGGDNGWRIVGKRSGWELGRRGGNGIIYGFLAVFFFGVTPMKSIFALGILGNAGHMVQINSRTVSFELT